MANQAGKSGRVFKTAWFSKAANKAHIADDELCAAIQQVMLGQADDLGGGVFKKRLNKNMHRSIVVVARTHEIWVYEYLFAKNDRANIEPDQLDGFRKLAKTYETLMEHQLTQLIENSLWMEICNGDQEKIQERRV